MWQELVMMLVVMAGAQPGHRRGPPRGPVKGDQSHFFGKEGEHRPPPGLPLPTILIAVAMAVILVAAKVYFKPSSSTADKRS